MVIPVLLRAGHLGEDVSAEFVSLLLHAAPHAIYAAQLEVEGRRGYMTVDLACVYSRKDLFSPFYIENVFSKPRIRR